MFQKTVFCLLTITLLTTANLSAMHDRAKPDSLEETTSTSLLEKWWPGVKTVKKCIFLGALFLLLGGVDARLHCLHSPLDGSHLAISARIFLYEHNRLTPVRLDEERTNEILRMYSRGNYVGIGREVPFDIILGTRDCSLATDLYNRQGL